jgi:hypothetical protein
VKVFAPILVKLLLIEDFRASIDVKVPTSDVIPIVMIKTVRIVRKSWLRIAPSDILIFSPKTEAIIIQGNSCKISKQIGIGRQLRKVYKFNNFLGKK